MNAVVAYNDVGLPKDRKNRLRGRAGVEHACESATCSILASRAEIQTLSLGPVWKRADFLSQFGRHPHCLAWQALPRCPILSPEPAQRVCPAACESATSRAVAESGIAAAMIPAGQNKVCPSLRQERDRLFRSLIEQSSGKERRFACFYMRTECLAGIGSGINLRSNYANQSTTIHQDSGGSRFRAKAFTVSGCRQAPALRACLTNPGDKRVRNHSRSGWRLDCPRQGRLRTQRVGGPFASHY